MRARDATAGSRIAPWAAAVVAVLGAGLAGCMSFGKPSAKPPPGVNFSGIWKLDAALSTDTEAALRKIVPQRRAVRARRERSGRERSGRGPLLIGASSQDDDALMRVPVDISLQKSLLSGGSYLDIRQRDGELIVSDGQTTHDYVAGEQNVVSIPNGAAQRRCGWRGKTYSVELRPQFGPKATERFHLEAGGKRLVETIEVGSNGRVRRLKVTRVYEPASKVPTLLPSGD